MIESNRHLVIEATQNFLLRPIIVHIVLDGFEVGGGDAAGIAQEIGDVEDVLRFEVLVRFRGHAAVGAFGNDLDARRHLLDRFAIDMTFDGGGDEDIRFLCDPGFAVFDKVASLFSGLLVDGAVLVHNGEQEVRIHTVLVAVGVGLLVIAVVAGNACDLAAEHFDESDGSILRHVTEAFDGSDGILPVHLQMFHGFANGIDHAIAGGLGATERAAITEGFACEYAGGELADELGIFVHHPAHHLRGGAHIGRGHIVAGTDVLPHHVHPTTAKAFLLMNGKRGGIHNDTTLAAAQGDVGDCALPRHPGSQSTDGVHGLIGCKANAAFVWAAGIVMLNAITLKDTSGAVIHAHRNAEGIFAHRPAQDFRHGGIQFEQFGNVVKLFLSHIKGIESFGHFLLLRYGFDGN